MDHIDNLNVKKYILGTFYKNKIPHKFYFFNYLNKDTFEIGLVVNLFGKNVIWILNKSDTKLAHLLFWEGGVFKVENTTIERLLFLDTRNNLSKITKEQLKNNLLKREVLITSSLLNKNLDKKFGFIKFLDNSSQIAFFATAFKYTQFGVRSLGELLIIAYRGCLEDMLDKRTCIPHTFKIDQLELFLKKSEHFEKISEAFNLTSDYLILKKDLSKEIIKELKDVYFCSGDVEIRRQIIWGLLKKENQCFVPKDIRNYLKYSLGFFPSSMSRLYTLKRLGFEESNVLAVNIYDIGNNPIDSSVYLDSAFEHSLPTILQVSLNASGQVETKDDGTQVLGYLKPKKGIYDFTASIIDVLVDMLSNINYLECSPPLIGLGIDHVDVKGDTPFGRASRFVQDALETETITHLTLDGSEHFKPRNKTINEIFNAYVQVFKTSLRFLENTSINSIDLEFCTGELNYIGDNKNPHYPDAFEISMLPYCFSEALKGEQNREKITDFLNSLKLYVGNLGTTHHGDDEEKSLKLELAEYWQEALQGTNFVSPVLHGTTGSGDELFSLASENCQKINIAGSLLKILLENLDTSQKELLGFNDFDEKSKYLCSRFSLIKNGQSIVAKKELKKEFNRYCKINNVKPISEEYEKIIRKPLFGRNKIATHIFLELEKKI